MLLSALSPDLVGSTETVTVTSLVINGTIRLAAIVAGTFVVWLGHTSLLQGIKGEFAFSGKFAKLKGSSPGLFFVLMGVSAIGWALAAKHEGSYGGSATGLPRTTPAESATRIPAVPFEETSAPDDSVPPPPAKETSP